MNYVEEPSVKLTGNYVNDYFHIADFLRKQAGGLEHLARAAYTVGNEKLAESLFAAASGTRSAADAVVKVCGDNVNEGLRAAQQGTANVLQALAGGIRLASSDPNALESAATLEGLAEKETPR
jgi:hypothetical protein